jgi:hypothetical protein
MGKPFSPLLYDLMSTIAPALRFSFLNVVGYPLLVLGERPHPSYNYIHSEGL